MSKPSQDILTLCYNIIHDATTEKDAMLIKFPKGSQPQKGIVTYALSANRQRPFAGVMSAAIFNTYRRSKAQFLYVVPPFVAGYLIMSWATEKFEDPILRTLGIPWLTSVRNHYYNSKEGRMHEPEASDEATQGGPVRG